MCSKPRVIAAEIKKDFCKDVIREKNGSKPHIAGELGLVGGTSSEPHWAEVRDGQLVVYPGPRGGCGPAWRIPLRHLHLQPAASGRPRGFSLTRHGEAEPIATFQVASELDYSRWVRTLAAELLKQTPLEAVKFLDILGITASIAPQEPQRSLSPEYHSEPECRSWELRCSPSPPYTAPRTYRRPELTQPLSLVITEEKPTSSYRKALFSSPEDCVDAPKLPRIEPILAKSTCFRNQKSRSNESIQYPPVVEEVVEKNKVKYLLKAFSRDVPKETTSPKPLHPLDMKDGGRTGRPPLPDVVKDLPPCDRRSRARTRTTPLRSRGKSVDVLPSTEDSRVAELMARCRQEDRYVPVRDKRLLFESLGRASSQPRFVLSSDNLTDLGDPTSAVPDPPRTQSLHDLSTNNVAVKEICRYFEQRGGSRGELAARSPSPECRLRLPTPGPGSRKPLGPLEPLGPRGAERLLTRLQQTVAECEHNIWRLQAQADKLSHTRSGGSTRLQVAVECRLEEERERLKKLQDEQFKLQRELESNPQPFGLTAAPRHHSNVR